MKNREAAQASRTRQKEYIAKLEEGNKELAERLELVERQNKELQQKLEFLVAKIPIESELLSLPSPLTLDSSGSTAQNLSSQSSSFQPNQPVESEFFDRLFPNAEPNQDFERLFPNTEPNQDVNIPSSAQKAEFESLFDFSPTISPTYPNLSFQPSLNSVYLEHKTGPTVTETLQQLSSLICQNSEARGLTLCGYPAISSIRCTQTRFSSLVEMKNGKEGLCGKSVTRCLFRIKFPICAEILDFVNKKTEMYFVLGSQYNLGEMARNGL
jgi:hypothetical protein